MTSVSQELRYSVRVLLRSPGFALIAITAVGNVPLNDDLAGRDVTTREAAVVARSAFEKPWNRLNLARTVVAVGSFVSLSTAAIVKSARDRA